MLYLARYVAFYFLFMFLCSPGMYFTSQLSGYNQHRRQHQNKTVEKKVTDETKLTQSCLHIIYALFNQHAERDLFLWL